MIIRAPGKFRFKTAFWPALLVLLVGFSADAVWASVPLYDLPQEMQLCGEPVPLNRQDVREMLDQQFVLSVYNTDQVILWIKRANRYFPYLENKLRQRNLPDDLKYVVVVESSFRTYAYSSAKAVGPWQFIESTGKRYGLKVNKQIDERLNFEKSTEAALNYLTDLYRMFNSWTLAMAAYNCGEEKVSTCMSVQGNQSYYDIDLPLETERYIFRVLAAKLILSSPERYGFIIPRDKKYPPLEFDRVEIDVPRDVHVMTIARAAGTTYKTIREMNPEIKQEELPRGRYVLNIPKGRADQFVQSFPGLMTEQKGAAVNNKKGGAKAAIR